MHKDVDIKKICWYTSTFAAILVCKTSTVAKMGLCHASGRIASMSERQNSCHSNTSIWPIPITCKSKTVRQFQVSTVATVQPTKLCSGIHTVNCYNFMVATLFWMDHTIAWFHVLLWEQLQLESEENYLTNLQASSSNILHRIQIPDGTTYQKLAL